MHSIVCIPQLQMCMKSMQLFACYAARKACGAKYSTHTIKLCSSEIVVD